MTRIGFYVLNTTDPRQRLQISARLADKAFQQGHRVFINASAEAEARALDELLWRFRATSFLPHALKGDDSDEPVIIGWGQDPEAHDDLLINLQLEVPRFFSRFRRVAELVTPEPGSLEALRKSWQFYRDRGYQLDKHTV